MSDYRTGLCERLSVKPVPFEANGVPVFLKPLTSAERQAVQQQLREADFAQPQERLFIAGICDGAGNRVFTTADLGAVSGFDGQVVEAVAVRVGELNGFADKPKPAG